MDRRFDAIIIGSGAGGAPIAHALARKGKSVLMLEKGPLFGAQSHEGNGISEFKRDELLATGPEKRITVQGVANRGQAYFASHLEPDLNDEPHIYRNARGEDLVTMEGYTAQVVGGGTQLYGGVSLRFTPQDFALRSFNDGRTDLRDDPNGDIQREARDWPISYSQLEPYYAKAENLIGINGTRENQAKPLFSDESYQRPLPPNPISRYVEAGMDALGMSRYRTPLAVITEDHAPSGRIVPSDRATIKTGFVNRYGDPLGFKSSTWVSLLHPIIGLPNFELRPNTVAVRLECEGPRISKVRFRGPDGEEGWAEAGVVVVACSAIESVRLLLLSAEEDVGFSTRIHHNRLLGKYFLTHCFGGAQVVVPDRHDKTVSLDSDWATDHCARPDFLKAHGLWAGGAIYNNTSDQAQPISIARTYGANDMDTIWNAFIRNPELTGEALAGFLDGNLGRRLSICFMANQVPLRENRIELHPGITDKWGRKCAHILKSWHAHDMSLMDLFADQCASILSHGLDGGRGKADVREKGGVYTAENGIARIANHILGGARFGDKEGDSVLDPSCRAWRFDNLYVTDGAFMPTSGSANPTLTIQANAFRVADILLGRL